MPMTGTQLRRYRKQLGLTQKQMAELQARLGTNSGNSSKPPSSDPPSAPKRPGSKPKGRRRGGQPGHEGKNRALIPVEKVDEAYSL